MILDFVIRGKTYCVVDSIISYEEVDQLKTYVQSVIAHDEYCNCSHLEQKLQEVLQFLQKKSRKQPISFVDL